jgi:hypothetical protein
MNLFKQVFSNYEVEILKSIVNSNPTESGWIFLKKESSIYSDILKLLRSKEILNDMLVKYPYIVIRVINKSSPQRTIEPHFDSHQETFYIPIETPS